MSGEGYTPAFETMYDGTLYGKWPTAVVWASLIPLINPRGEINMTYEAIAGRTGWPMDLLRQGIDQLMQPDPGSRSEAEQGRRLILLDPRRNWGWRAVNHGIYREKARLLGKRAREVESGENAQRMRDRRGPPETAGDRYEPPTSPGTASPDLNPDADSEKKSPVGEGLSTVPRAGAREGGASPALPLDSRGTTGAIDCGDGLTRSAADLLEEERNAWRDVEGVNPEAMQAWLDHGARLKPPKDLPSHVRISLAKTLAGYGDFAEQAAAVKRCIDGGWRNLRPRTAEDRAAAKPSESDTLQKLKARRPHLGIPAFRDPHPGETADQYRQAQDAAWNLIQRERDRAREQRRPSA